MRPTPALQTFLLLVLSCSSILCGFCRVLLAALVALYSSFVFRQLQQAPSNPAFQAFGLWGIGGNGEHGFGTEVWPAFVLNLCQPCRPRAKTVSTLYPFGRNGRSLTNWEHDTGEAFAVDKGHVTLVKKVGYSIPIHELSWLTTFEH